MFHADSILFVALKITHPLTHGSRNSDLSKVPSVSMSGISHIPISRCFTVSRLDGIRRLQRSMLPPGVFERDKDVLPPAPRGDESVLHSAQRGVWMRPLSPVWYTKVHDRISNMRNYITSAQL